jgi:limonene 1,2-monooxygenase
MAHEWADRAETLRSYELIARYVMPAFQTSAGALVASRDWAADNRPTFIGEAGAAVFTAIQKHNEERQQLSSPEGDDTTAGAADVTRA